MDENTQPVGNGQEAQAEGEGGNKKKSMGRELMEWVEAIVIAVLAALVIRSFVFTVVRVDGSSMNNTLANNDRLIVWRLGYEPEQGDIVIFAPESKNTDTNVLNRIYWVKRVIATEGQHVDIDYAENAVYVDGEKLDEPYIAEPMEQPQSPNTITSIDLQEGELFLMGDNRNNSQDSRYIGAVKKEDLVGRAVLRFWPFGSFGGVK